MPAEPRKPRLIPVLDVMGGQVVRAVGGRRERYWPVVSTLTDSTEPVAVATTLLAATGANELYVADLDAICERHGPSDVVRDLLNVATGPVWLDCGLTGLEELSELRLAPRVQHVFGLETADSPSAVSSGASGALRPTAFSLDLRDGCLLGN